MLVLDDAGEVVRNEDGSLKVVPKTDGGQSYDSIVGHLFTARGKWKYDVKLDYTGIWEDTVNGLEYEQLVSEERKQGRIYRDPRDAAWDALLQATRAGSSGVSIESRESGYILVVPDPPNGIPVIAGPLLGLAD